MMSQERAGIWRPAAAIALAIVASGVVAYWRATWMLYARSDDYVYVYNSRVGDLSAWYDWNFQLGRPIPGWIMTSAIPGVSEISDLALLRLAVVVWVALSGAAVALLFLLLTRERPGWVRSVAAFGIGLVPLTTTSAPNAVTWAILAAAIAAFAVAVLAGSLMLWHSRWWWLASFALMLMVAFSYQQMVPLAMLPPLFAFAVAFVRRERLPWWRTVMVGVIGVVSLALNAWWILSLDGVGASRMNDATLPERLDWFLHAFLPLTVDLSLPSSPASMKVSIGIALVGVAMPLVLGWRHFTLPVAALLSYGGAAMMVFPLEMWASYRLASPAQFALWVSVALCVGYTAVHLRWRPVGALLAVAGVVCGFVALNVSRERAEEYLAKPNADDLRGAACFVRQHPDLGPDLPIYSNYYANTSSPVLASDEYGVIASSVVWSFEPQLWLVLDGIDGPGRPAFTSGDLDIEPYGAAPDPNRLAFPARPCEP